MPRLNLSPWQRHVAKWKGCTKCNLHHGRTNVVLGRGQVPCEVVFVAEAPGKTEDVLAEPLTGPAGHLFNGIVKRAIDNSRPFTFACTNLVCCIPLDAEGRKTGEPYPEEIKACRGRLIEFLRIAKPRLVVNVGTLSRKWSVPQAELEPVDWLPATQDFIEYIDIIHPAAIGRANAVLQPSLVNRTVVTLASAIERLDNPLPF